MKGRVVLLDEVNGARAAALLVDGRLEDLLIDPPEDHPPGPGAIYRGVVDRPMKGQGGVTVTLGEGKKGFLRQAKGLAPGERLLVQISTYAEPDKAQPVTQRLLFKSRYAILTPDAPGINVSRSIRDDHERDRLLEIAHDTMAHRDGGLILRSAAEGASEEAVASDINQMTKLTLIVFEDQSDDPELLLDAPDAHELAWRDWATPAPDDVRNRRGSFDDLGVYEAIQALQGPNVPLGGGAHALIEPTRALIAVDVNTGRDTSPAAGLKANLSLARDLPRQLRLRGLGGQITLDLAPMPKKDRRAFETALRRAFKADDVDTTLAGWTPLGHYELQRKRARLPLSQVLK